MNRIFPGVITMPLQIRRGTDVERRAMTVPLAQGELLYVTDDQRLYIGNGATLGGVQITGYTNEDAQDAAASLLTTGTHTGISFTYDDASNKLNATVNLASYSGLIEGDVSGSVFADDSTLLVDGVSGRIVGPVFANVTGDVTGNLNGNVTGNVTGNVIGNLTGNVTGNTTGYHTGDVKGSIFGDDSTILVDAVSNTITASLIDTTTVRTTYISNGSLSVKIQANATDYVSEFYGLTTGTGGPRVALRVGAGSDVTIPTNTQAGDRLGQFIVEGYADNSWKDAASIYGSWDSTATLTDSSPASILTFIVGNGSGQTYASFNYKGSFSAPILQPTAFATEAARNSSVTAPEAGMMTYITDICKFQGYVADTGLAGGGPSNATPGWVNLN